MIECHVLFVFVPALRAPQTYEILVDRLRRRGGMQFRVQPDRRQEQQAAEHADRNAPEDFTSRERADADLLAGTQAEPGRLERGRFSVASHRNRIIGHDVCAC